MKLPMPPSSAIWSTPEMSRALAERDIQLVYKILIQIGYSEDDIARMTRQSPKQVAEIMNGHRISVATLLRICDGLRIPMDALGLCSPKRAGRRRTTRYAVLRTVDASCGCRARHALDMREPRPARTIPPRSAEVRLVLTEEEVRVIRQILYMGIRSRARILPAGEAGQVWQWNGSTARVLREAYRLSVRAFAAKLGISDRMVSKWEAGGAQTRRGW